MSKLPNDERETHISMSSLRNKMKIYTTERHIMRRLDRYVEESDNWKVVDIGMLHGEVVSKTYEAPRDLLLTRKQKRVMTEEQRQKSAERLRALREKKHGKKVDEKADETDNDTGFGAEDDLAATDSDASADMQNAPKSCPGDMRRAVALCRRLRLPQKLVLRDVAAFRRVRAQQKDCLFKQRRVRRAHHNHLPVDAFYHGVCLLCL